MSAEKIPPDAQGDIEAWAATQIATVLLCSLQRLDAAMAQQQGLVDMFRGELRKMIEATGKYSCRLPGATVVLKKQYRHYCACAEHEAQMLEPYRCPSARAGEAIFLREVEVGRALVIEETTAPQGVLRVVKDGERV